MNYPTVYGTSGIRESLPVKYYTYGGTEPFTGPVKTRPTAEQIAADLAAGNEPWHGTLGGTTNHRCKCTPCRTVWAGRAKQERTKQKEKQK